MRYSILYLCLVCTILALHPQILSAATSAQAVPWTLSPVIGTLGAGLEFGYRPHALWGVRLSATVHPLPDKIELNRVSYKADGSSFGAGLLFDLFPRRNGFRLSAGLSSESGHFQQDALPKPHLRRHKPTNFGSGALEPFRSLLRNRLDRRRGPGPGLVVARLSGGTVYRQGRRRLQSAGHIRSTPLAPEIRGASAPGARKRDASSTPLPLVPGDFSGAGLPLLSVRKYPFAGDSICCVDCYRFQACNAGYAVRTAIGGTCSEPTARHTPGCPD